MLARKSFINSGKHLLALAALALMGSLAANSLTAAWHPAQGPLMTRWAKDVSPQKAHPEYPRPQMERQQWMNLNGLWEYAITPKDAPKPTKWDGEILVPFPVESALSGVMKMVGPDQMLWYHRTFKLPADWKEKHVLLHFGAVDWESRVWVNGWEYGPHRGGYDGFSYDITDVLKPELPQEILVAVWDPTDAGTQPRGKQVRNPHGIWYTPTSGIWQTVWLEPVNASYIESLKLVPDIDNGRINVSVKTRGEMVGATVETTATIGKDEVGKVVGAPDELHKVPVPDAKLWSPDSPFLYDLKVILRVNGKVTDEVTSYFGMRKNSLCKDD